MKIEQVRQLQPKDRLIYFVKERESIRLKKEAGEEKPWTDDEILQTYKFTNVRRMDDRTSKWLMENWYEPNFNHPNMLVAVAVARFVNLPSSLEAIGKYILNDKRPSNYEISWQTVKFVLRALRKHGPIFSGAYMVRGNDGMDKVECVIDYYVKPLEKTRIDRGSMEKTHDNLLASYGMGSFMAGQVVSDLRHAMEGSWIDRHTWAAVGPGSSRGLHRFYGRSGAEIKKLHKQSDFLVGLNEVTEYCKRKLSRSITGRLEAIDFQNILCEFDKESRVLFGEGRPKQKYPGT